MRLGHLLGQILPIVQNASAASTVTGGFCLFSQVSLPGSEILDPCTPAAAAFGTTTATTPVARRAAPRRPHEDYGMMSTIEVTGEEGTRCLAQQDVIYGCDVCYTGATGGRGYCYKNNTPGAETMAPTPAKESDGAAAPVVGAVAAAVIAVVALL